MKKALILGAIIIAIGTVAYFVLPSKQSVTQTPIVTEETPTETQPSKQTEIKEVTPVENGRVASPETPSTPTEAPAGKLKVANFTGTLQQVNTGCFSDGECFVVVDGKHITTVMGWSQAEVGSVLGVDSFGDLEKHIGQQVAVYAKDNADGTYTLYGSNGFYVKLLQ